MAVPSTCPFCNAIIPANVQVVDGRVACPRCGETVATVHTAASLGTTPTGTANTPTGGTERSRRRVAFTVAALILAAVAVWLVTANWHRFRSPFGNPTPAAKPVVVKPTELPGLGYLPESTEAILAIQVPFLLQRLGPEAGNDPIEALTSLGVPRQVAELLDDATAVGLRNVDQLVVGIAFETHAMPPQLTVVVHAARPFDLDGLARQEKARPLKRDGRTLYVGKAGMLPEIYWWKAADRVLVATILAKDMDAVPTHSRAGTDHLRPALTGLMRDAVADDACGWFVASADKWHQYLRPYTLPLLPTPLQGRTDLLPAAERLRSIALSVPNDVEKKVEVRIGLKSAEAGASLRTAFTERFRGESVEVSGQEEWARLHLPNDPTQIGPIVGRLTAGGK